jgi:hypothetical protein
MPRMKKPSQVLAGNAPSHASAELTEHESGRSCSSTPRRPAQDLELIPLDVTSFIRLTRRGLEWVVQPAQRRQLVWPPSRCSPTAAFPAGEVRRCPSGTCPERRTERLGVDYRRPHVTSLSSRLRWGHLTLLGMGSKAQTRGKPRRLRVPGQRNGPQADRCPDVRGPGSPGDGYGERKAQEGTARPRRAERPGSRSSRSRAAARTSKSPRAMRHVPTSGLVLGRFDQAQPSSQPRLPSRRIGGSRPRWPSPA